MGPFPTPLVLVLLLNSLLASTISGQQSGFDSNKVDQMLQHALECHKTPGMAVAVVKDGKILYSKGFGFTDLDKKAQVTGDTLFGIASISKSFAAALLVKLIKENTNFTLDSKVRELLGDDFVMPDEFRTEETTFTDMLSHKTALLANNRIRYDNDFNRDTLLRRLRLLPSTKQFRVDYIYSNLVYGLVGRLAEIIDKSDKRWEELVEQHFFKPLGMTKSTFLTRIDYTRKDYARGFVERDGPNKPEMVTPLFSKKWGEVCASGAVMSSVNDMAKWMNFHLQLGKNGKGETVMDKTLVSQLHEPQFVTTPLNYLDIEQPKFPITAYTGSYAMGLRVGHYRGLEFITHTGTTFGYSAVMALLPSKKIGVITLINNSDRYFRQRAAVLHYLLDSALGLEPYINDTTICTFPDPWVDEKDLSYTYRPKRSNVPFTFSTEEYEGNYTNEAFGKMEIEFNSTLDSPVLTYGWGNWELMVWPKGDGKNQEQRLFAKAIGPVIPGDLYPMHFIAHPNNKKVVVGFRANALEKKRPPIFCKEDQMAVCTDIVKKTYPQQSKEEEEKENERGCHSSAVSIILSHCKIGPMNVFLPAIAVVLSLLLAKN